VVLGVENAEVVASLLQEREALPRVLDMFGNQVLSRRGGAGAGGVEGVFAIRRSELRLRVGLHEWDAWLVWALVCVLSLRTLRTVCTPARAAHRMPRNPVDFLAVLCFIPELATPLLAHYCCVLLDALNRTVLNAEGPSAAAADCLLGQGPSGKAVAAVALPRPLWSAVAAGDISLTCT
jgi:hypothetical protein